jgi:hypothetical protein
MIDLFWQSIEQKQSAPQRSARKQLVDVEFGAANSGFAPRGASARGRGGRGGVSLVDKFIDEFSHSFFFD